MSAPILFTFTKLLSALRARWHTAWALHNARSHRQTLAHYRAELAR
jgi:hypothetical protein